VQLVDHGAEGEDRIFKKGIEAIMRTKNESQSNFSRVNDQMSGSYARKACSMFQKQEDVQCLWQEYSKTRDWKLRNVLVEHYTPLVHKQAARLSRKLPSQIHYDEICSAGYNGLIEAVEAYDPEKKAKFETFCQKRIVGAVIDWLRALDTQSRTVRSFEKKRCVAKELLNTELGRPPTHEETAERMGIERERYNQLARISDVGQEVHFSTMNNREAASMGEHNERQWDIPDHKQSDPSDKLARNVLTDFIARGLTGEERLILVLYYYEDLTMAEIGSVLDLSESRVSQIHKEVISRLRHRFKNKKYTEYMVA